MLATSNQAAMTFPHFVARGVGGDAQAYLRLAANGAQDWVADASAATSFENLREATRLAMRLPSKLRAFGILLRD